LGTAQPCLSEILPLPRVHKRECPDGVRKRTAKPSNRPQDGDAVVRRLTHETINGETRMQTQSLRSKDTDPLSHDVGQLETGINRFVDILVKLTNQETIEELIRIWRRPGWTTPAEFMFASGVLDSMIALANQLDSMESILLQGSELVGFEG
jgi:hypothetical protein